MREAADVSPAERESFSLQSGEVDKDEGERMRNVLRPLVYEWNGKRFVPVGGE